MSFFSDTRETSVRYRAHIAEFQEFCKRHDAGAGTPEDFFRLAPKLAYDEKFRADFCQLTKSMAQREEGRLTLTRILTIIALAMGGEDIDEIGTAGAVPVSLVVVFLAGVGGWSQGENDGVTAVEESLPSSTPPDRMDEAMALTEGEEQEALELERRLAAEPNDLGEMTRSLFGGPAQVNEALCRLELNTLELKLHLDSIDSRIERIEPHLDDLTSRLANDGPRKIEPSRQVETYRQMETAQRTPLPSVRFSQPELRTATAVTETEVTPVSASPDRVEMRRLQQIVTALALLLVAMAGVLGTLLYLSHGRLVKDEIGKVLAGTVGDASAKTASAAPSIREAAEPRAAIPSPTSASGTRRSETDTSTFGKPQPKEAETSRDAAPSAPVEIAHKINLSKNNEEREEPPNAPAIHLADVLPGAVAAKTESGPGVAVIPGEAASLSAPVERAASLTGDKAVVSAASNRIKIFVPANVLVRNAIASPPPLYPSLARIRRVEGDVVLQILVDESGKIETASVVNGPEPLRNAAMDALRNWRFRPYMIDGHPVAVRTLVNFHFKMTQ